MNRVMPNARRFDIEFWDEELAELASTSVDLFGDDVVSLAIEQTFLRMRLNSNIRYRSRT